MIRTPLTATTITPKRGDPSFFKPRTGGMRGQAWGVLATHYKAQQGYATCTLHTLLASLLYGHPKGSIGIKHHHNYGDDLAIVFNDGTMLVGRTDRSCPPLPYRKDKWALLNATTYVTTTVRFSPVVFTADPRKVASSQHANAHVSGLYPIALEDGAATAFYQEVSNAVADANAMGPVTPPWATQPGGLSAPWILGAGEGQALIDLAWAGLFGLGMADTITRNTVINGLTLCPKGTVNTDELTVYAPSHRNTMPRAHVQRLQDWLRERLARPGCPISPYACIAHESNQERLGARGSQRRAAVIANLDQPLNAISHHERLRLHTLFHETDHW